MKKIILDEIVDIATNLISYKTTKDEYKEIDKALLYIKQQLSDYYFEEVMVGKYKNLVISNTKEHNLDIIFCGHIDVVPALEYKAIKNDNKLLGRGSFDMKSQLAVMISLLKNNTSNKKIALIITSDEEIGGLCCKQIISNYNAKLAVIPDGGKNFELVVEEKGLLQLEVIAKGITSHASEPYKGVNPILTLMDLYNKVLKIYPMPKNEKQFITTVNLSKISGGDANNMVPSEARMVLDIRFTKEINVDSIISQIKDINKDIEINILDQGPVFSVDENLPIIKDFVNSAELVLGRKIVIKKCVATSDAIYFSEKNIPTIIMNPDGDYWHSPNEYVNIDSLYQLYKIFKTLL
jgi:acetylornithine deacetylase/succinyl-diaminopimelate desuccinylase-like protein